MQKFALSVALFCALIAPGAADASLFGESAAVTYRSPSLSDVIIDFGTVDSIVGLETFSAPKAELRFSQFALTVANLNLGGFETADFNGFVVDFLSDLDLRAVSVSEDSDPRFSGATATLRATKYRSTSPDRASSAMVARS